MGLLFILVRPEKHKRQPKAGLCGLV